MLTGQSNFSSVMSHFWPFKIFTKKSSTCNVSLIKPTNIICLFQSLLDRLKSGLISFWTDLTPVVRMAFLSIFNAWQTASEWSLAVWTDMRWCKFSWEVIIKKEIKTLSFTVGDLIVYSRMNNVTVSTWHDWSTWPASEVFGRSSHRSGQTLPVDRPLFWALNIHQSNRSYIYICSCCVTKTLHLWLEGTECQRMYSRRTKLKLCGSKYSMFTIFYTLIFVHNKSNSYQTMFK